MPGAQLSGIGACAVEESNRPKDDALKSFTVLLQCRVYFNVNIYVICHGMLDAVSDPDFGFVVGSLSHTLTSQLPILSSTPFFPCLLPVAVARRFGSTISSPVV